MMKWTEEKVDQLKAFWRAGWTYERMSLALGVSRNTIAGKCRRLKLRRGHVGQAVKQIARKSA